LVSSTAFSKSVVIFSLSDDEVGVWNVKNRFFFRAFFFSPRNTQVLVRKRDILYISFKLSGSCLDIFQVVWKLSGSCLCRNIFWP
jgi:hypothetical protein